MAGVRDGMATGDLLVTLDALKASYDSLNEAPVEIQITTGQWNGSGPYTYTVNATNVTANTKIKVQMDSTINNLTSDLSVTTGSGNIVLSTSSLPSGTVNVTIFFIGAQGDVTTQVLADVYSTSQAVAKADVVDNLINSATNQPLSANMGKTLAAKAIDTSGNGYCKFADGTLICWGTYTDDAIASTQVGSLYYALNINVDISFAITFTAKPAITITPASSTYNIISEVSAGASGISKVSIARPNSGNVTPSFSWIAIGRWKA